MDVDGLSSNSQLSQTSKGGKFFWNDFHDTKLVECLHLLSLNKHWKVDTGFRTGYLSQLERMMEEKVPGCGIKAVPNIESRLKTLKKQTLAIAEMLNNGSGFAWDDVEKKIISDLDVFKLWCQSHKDAKGLRNKIFPHFEILVEIYAKDRANGNAAADPADVEDDILNSIDIEDEDTVGGDGIDASSTHGETTPPTDKSKDKNITHKRHKSNDGFAASLGEMAQSLKKFVDSSQVNMEKMAAAISVDPKSEQGLKVVAELQTIEDLDLDDLMAASNLIVGNASNESLLFTLQGAQKKRMVLKLLGKAPAHS